MLRVKAFEQQIFLSFIKPVFFGFEISELLKRQVLYFEKIYI